MAFKKYFIALFSFLFIIAVLIITVSASSSENILKLPLFEVGLLWLKAAEKLIRNLTEVPDMTSPWLYIKVASACSFLYGIWWVFMRPLNRVRKLGDIGYIAEGVLSVKETANIIQKRRRVGMTPPAYPNGWFGLMESFMIKKGEVKGVTCLGLNLAVFRDEKGTVHALDAYCPHMGANLAAGGRVRGDCLECPFHAWKFRGDDGKCTYIPTTDKIPDVARVKSWPVQELTGWIYLWFHADGAEPTWQVTEIEEIEKGSWAYGGRTEHHVNAHIQEIPENAADVVHLKLIHGPVIVAGTDLRTIWKGWASLIQHDWTASWEPCPAPNAHVAQMTLHHEVKVCGVKLPFFALTVVAKQMGPGVVYLKFNGLFGKGVFIHTVLPMGPLTQKVVHNVYANRWMPTFIAKLYMIAEAVQVDRDIMIWNNKQYEGKPIFVKSKEDSLIAKHRRWFSQFYCDNSPKIFQKDTLEF